MIRSIVAREGTVRNRDVVEATGLTRQAARYHLSALVRDGELRLEGKGRGATYLPNWDLVIREVLPGLEEDVLWRRVRDKLPALAPLPDNVTGILGYAFTEMVNNAIDHSSGSWVTVRFRTGGVVAFEVLDDGVGVFRHVRERFDLPDDLSAIGHLAKGKQTTMPDRHSGEGIFFTSRATDRFVLESGGTRWTVDTLIEEQAIGDVPSMDGTLVRCELRADAGRSLRSVFDAHTEDTGFARSSVAVRAFQEGDILLSRSQARRLATGLERFKVVTVDLAGVEEVGQGFVDELFRVWASAHPDTTLVPEGMGPNVEAMIRRVRGAPSR